jgi:hypothetical protein
MITFPSASTFGTYLSLSILPNLIASSFATSYISIFSFFGSNLKKSELEKKKNKKVSVLEIKPNPKIKRYFFQLLIKLVF